MGYDKGTSHIRALVCKSQGVNPSLGLKLLDQAVYSLGVDEAAKLANYLAGSFAALPETQLMVGDQIPESVRVAPYQVAAASASASSSALVEPARLIDFLSEQNTAYVIIALSAT